jgi:AbrB family looped-hinge helix DNA binding protein
MTYQTTITKKGQVTVPKAVRDALNIKLGSKVDLTFDEKKKTVKIKPLPSLKDIAGRFKVKNPKNAVEMRAYMERHYRRV